jgi:hypothetical protein
MKGPFVFMRDVVKFVCVIQFIPLFFSKIIVTHKSMLQLAVCFM